MGYHYEMRSLKPGFESAWRFSEKPLKVRFRVKFEEIVRAYRSKRCKLQTPVQLASNRIAEKLTQGCTSPLL